MKKAKRPAKMILKPVVTVPEMASLVGLSRSRFYELMREGIFPQPLFEMFGNRAVYIEPWQRVCIEVRRTGLGANGHRVRFRSHLPSNISTNATTLTLSLRRAKKFITKMSHESSRANSR